MPHRHALPKAQKNARPLRLRLQIAWALALALGCGHSIPPPVQVVPADADDHTAQPNPANADPKLDPPFGPYDVQTVFYIAKSNDKDHVDYGMRLDRHCVPTGDDAVFPYWRELEKTPPTGSHPLKFHQYMAYGFSEQRTLKKGRTGGRYRVVLKQVDRPILIVSKQGDDGRCTATAYTTVKGVKHARLDYIFVKVAGMASADWVDVHGTHPETGAELVERLTR